MSDSLPQACEYNLCAESAFYAEMFGPQPHNFVVSDFGTDRLTAAVTHAMSERIVLDCNLQYERTAAIGFKG